MTIENGKIVVISGTGGELSGNDGAIINLKLHVEDRNEATVPIKITNAVYAQPDGTRVAMPNVTIPFTVNAIEMGDANNDQSVTVADVVGIVNNIVGRGNDSFIKRVADYNQDGLIDVSDAQLVLNKVLRRNTSRQTPDDMFDPQ